MSTYCALDCSYLGSWLLATVAGSRHACQVSSDRATAVARQHYPNAHTAASALIRIATKRWRKAEASEYATLARLHLVHRTTHSHLRSSHSVVCGCCHVHVAVVAVARGCCDGRCWAWLLLDVHAVALGGASQGSTYAYQRHTHPVRSQRTVSGAS